LDLPPELESLRPLILSQHKAFKQRIRDLGALNLNITKTLEKKSTSLQHLTNHDKIPRSLRIKCELTTSPEFSNDPEFLEIKHKLHQEVSNFIQKGTSLMTVWVKRNITLLTLQRCSNYLKKALQILEGLTSFYTDSIGTPKWKSVSNNLLTLSIFKAFLSGEFIEVNDFATYLNLTPDQILLTGAKLILSTDSDKDAAKIIFELNLSDIKMENQAEELFITEFFANFSQILQFTTTGIWKAYKEKSKKTTAGFNLSSKMKEMDTLSATEATALALTTATENAEISQLTNAEANLRIDNLERASRKQEQTTNELAKQLKPKHSQKNFIGSHSKEQMTSPTPSAPSHSNTNTSKKHQFVDLTLEENNNQNINITPKNYTNKSKTKETQKTECIINVQNRSNRMTKRI